MRTPLGVAIFIAVILFIDFYVFLAIRTVSAGASYKIKLAVYIFYWLLTALTITGFLLFVYTGPDFLGRRVRTYLFATLIGLFLAKVLSVLFFLIDDLRRLVQWAISKFSSNKIAANGITEDRISRSVFLSWIGLAAGGSLFGSLLYGFSNKYNYQVKKIQLAFDDLPAGFRGLRIAHVSDIHSGSFTDKHAVSRGVKLILDQQPDIILFTGDLVNDRSDEMKEYVEVFNQLKDLVVEGFSL